jgi:carbon storage regulator CsrA
MLVLTRRAGESIMIDDDIELKVLKIRGSQVHSGYRGTQRCQRASQRSLVTYSGRR